jgi:formamidopyrimidine-DNA glycosylase
MPELPEVEAARRMISEICLQSKIVTAKVREQGGGPRNDLFDDIIYEQEGSGNDESYEKAFVGKTIAQVYRKGKHLWVHMSGKPINSYILFHFGMTGSFVAKGIIFPTYKAFKVDDSQWPPRFTKLELVFENGIHLAFCDPRRLGRIRLCKGDPLTQAPSISKLATDPLLEVVNVDTASALLSKLTCPIKALLLDQEKLVCGVGNWVADEVLYQAKIHPSSPCNALPEPVVAALLHALQSVLKTAVSQHPSQIFMNKSHLRSEIVYSNSIVNRWSIMRHRSNFPTSGFSTHVGVKKAMRRPR